MRNHLQYTWWQYLAVILAPIVIWCSLFSSLAAPKPQEQLDILCIGQNWSVAELQTELEAVMPQISRQPLQKITVDILAPAELTDNLITARCFDYDILIFEAAYFPVNGGQRFFARLTEELMNHFPENDFYQESVEGGTLCFGLKAQDSSRLHRYYTGQDTLLLFMSPYSVNFNGLNEYGNPGYDAALKALQHLLERTTP